MTDTAPQSAADPGGDSSVFVYQGWIFECSARLTERGVFEPVAVCRGQDSQTADTRLPNDTDETAYATEAEALRHAQQQAMRWVHDRTGDGQGRF